MMQLRRKYAFIGLAVVRPRRRRGARAARPRRGGPLRRPPPSTAATCWTWWARPGPCRPSPPCRSGRRSRGRSSRCSPTSTRASSKDQVLARLDPSLLHARLGQAQANLVAARPTSRGRGPPSRTREQKFARAQTLAAEQLLPQADLETARATYAEAAAQLKASQAAVTQAAANVRQAQVDMTHTIITRAHRRRGGGAQRRRRARPSPPPSQAPVLFVIANDLSQHAGERVHRRGGHRPRARGPGGRPSASTPTRTRRSPARVEQVRLQPITVQNVVTYTTIIAVNNPGQRLMPGMTATVSVVVGQRDDVLRIPAAGAALPARRVRRDRRGAARPARRRGRPGAPGAGARRRRRRRGQGGGAGGGRGGRRAGARAAAADACRPPRRIRADGRRRR